MRPKKKSMSESAQAFYLRLNNHKSFLTEALTQLYHNAVLVDCTLTAKGGQLRAHQTVLSACSSYFKEIFSQHNTSQYPVVVIKDMPFADLKAIIEYIYCGEVTIPRRQLQSVLNSGALLQVKGLYEFNHDNLPDIIESDVETCAENRYECNGSDNNSEVKQNGKKYSEKNSLNACESSGNLSPNEKGTRKSRKGSEKYSNRYDRESENLGKTLPSTKSKRVYNNIETNIETNDRITNNNDNTHDSLKRENLPKNPIKLMNGNERLTKVSTKSTEISSESAVINTNVNEHNMEKSMTGKPALCTVSGGADNIVPLKPFAPLQQSFMIDVNSNVNQASHPSEFGFGFINNKGTYNTATTGADDSDSSAKPDTSAIEKSEQQNQKQNELKDKINDINICGTNSTFANLFNEIPPLEEINEKSFDVNQTQRSSRKRSLISATDEEQKHPIVKKKNSKECKTTPQEKADSNKKYDCPVCHKSYASKPNMKEHIRNMHSCQKKYLCTFCQKEYGWKHAMDRHIKSKHTAN